MAIMVAVRSTTICGGKIECMGASFAENHGPYLRFAGMM